MLRSRGDPYAGSPGPLPAAWAGAGEFPNNVTLDAGAWGLGGRSSTTEEPAVSQLVAAGGSGDSSVDRPVGPGWYGRSAAPWPRPGIGVAGHTATMCKEHE